MKVFKGVFIEKDVINTIRQHISTNKENVVDNLIINFDIETSTIPVAGEPIQAVYLVNMYVVTTDGEKICSIFYRTLSEFIAFLQQLSQKEKYIIYAHNLNYELTFLLRELPTSSAKRLNRFKGEEENASLFRAIDSPINVCLQDIPNVEFRCSYALSNKTIAKLGEELGLVKLDYDYKAIRTPLTKLEKHDYDYCQRDNEIASVYILNRLKEHNETITNIPMTFTSATKKARQKHIQSVNRWGVKNLNDDLKNVLVDFQFYNACTKAYQGGLTCAHYHAINKSFENVNAIDITSSYPFQMCARKFPYFHKDHTYILEGDEGTDFFEEYLLNEDSESMIKRTGGTVKGYIVTIELDNLKIKNDKYLHSLSASFCWDYDIWGRIDGTVVNGKVMNADKVTVTLSNVAYDWLCLCYSFDSFYVRELIITKKRRQLRYEEVSFLLKNFDIKQNIDKEKYPTEYALSKVYINAMYGVKVQKQLRDEIILINGDILERKLENMSEEERENRYYEEKERQQEELEGGNGFFNKNFDIFTDGLYITDYARLHLLQCMVEIVEQGGSIIYADTDSLKFHHPQGVEWVKSFVERINKDIIHKNKKNPRFLKYKEEAELTREQFENILVLGTWDIENMVKGEVIPYTTFKTMGAKKYAYTHDNKINITVAGLNKKKGAIALMEVSKRYNLTHEETIDKYFNMGTLWDTSCSGRTLSIKEKREREECDLLRYEGQPLYSRGGFIIEDTSYTLNISKNDSRVLQIEPVHQWKVRINSEGVVKHA